MGLIPGVVKSGPLIKSPATLPGTTQMLVLSSTGVMSTQEITSGTNDHGALTGLGDDDHTQYLNQSRGDARYLQLSGGDVSGPLRIQPATGYPLRLGANGAVGAYCHGSGGGFAFPQAASVIPCDINAGLTDNAMDFGMASYRFKTMYLYNIDCRSLVFLGAYTVAALPSASANDGATARVIDSSVTTYRSTVAGGGSNKVKVFSNGTDWLVC